MTVKVNLYGGNIEGEVVDEGATTTGGGWEGVGEFPAPLKSTGGGSRHRSAMATRGRQHESGMSGQHSALRTCNLQCGGSATNGEHTMKRQQRRRRVDPCATESRTPWPRGRDATADRRMRGPRGRRIASWRRRQRGCSLQREKYVGSGTVDDADGKWQLNK